MPHCSLSRHFLAEGSLEYLAHSLLTRLRLLLEVLEFVTDCIRVPSLADYVGYVIDCLLSPRTWLWLLLVLKSSDSSWRNGEFRLCRFSCLEHPRLLRV